MFFMFFAWFIVYKNVIQIYLTKIVKKIEKQFVYVNLSIDEIVDEFERHNVIFINFEKTKKRDKFFVFEIHSNFVKNENNVQFRNVQKIHNSR